MSATLSSHPWKFQTPPLYVSIGHLDDSPPFNYVLSYFTHPYFLHPPNLFSELSTNWFSSGSFRLKETRFRCTSYVQVVGVRVLLDKGKYEKFEISLYTFLHFHNIMFLKQNTLKNLFQKKKNWSYCALYTSNYCCYWSYCAIYEKPQIKINNFYSNPLLDQINNTVLYALAKSFLCFVLVGLHVWSSVDQYYLKQRSSQ